MVIACLASLWVVIPFLWAIDNSFKTPAEIFKPGALVPFLQFSPTLDTWTEVLGDPQALNCLFSSALVGVGTTLLVLLLGTPAAYSLARFEFKMKSRDITLWFLSQRVLPPVVVLTPFYIFLAWVGLIDTWIGLILLYSTFNLAFCVVIMRDIFRDVSK
jgi:multiple sugar transport system permease protein